MASIFDAHDCFDQLLARVGAEHGATQFLRFSDDANLIALIPPIYAALRPGRVFPERPIAVEDGRGLARGGDEGDAWVVETLPPATHDGPSRSRWSLLVGATIVTGEDGEDGLARSLQFSAPYQHLIDDACTAAALAARDRGARLICDHVDAAFARFRAVGPCSTTACLQPAIGRRLLGELHRALRGDASLPATVLPGGEQDAWAWIGEHEDLVLGYRYWLSSADGETEGWALVVGDLRIDGSFGLDYGNSEDQIHVRAPDEATLLRIVGLVRERAAALGSAVRSS